jgi:hypothetical protein
MDYRTNFRIILVLFSSVCCVTIVPLFGQQVRKKPTRASAPTLAPQEFEGVFFADVQKQLVGPAPTSNAQGQGTLDMESGSPVNATSNNASSSENNLWKERISGQSIEDLVKEGKGRLDTFITTPSKFTGGSYKDARREFTLLAILFAAIEQYPEKIRWQASAALARGRFGRVAANTKIASTPTFNEAKLRMDDLSTLLKGSALTDSAPLTELVWSDIADRVPSMQILEWALREHLNRYVSSEAEFKSHSEDILKYAELVALIGETLHQPGMTDADDAEYKSWSTKMVQEATKLSEAVKLNNPSMAREAAGQLDQSCNACHNTFR